MIAFFPIYYVFPNTSVSAREVLPGVLVAAVGWLGLKRLFNLYIAFSAKPDLYGLVGTLLLLVVWLYIGGLVLLVGAAVNATLAGRGGDSAARRSGKRRFGRQVTDLDSFGDRLDDLIAQTAEAAVPAEALRRTLRRRAVTLGRGRNGPSRSATEDEARRDGR